MSVASRTAFGLAGVVGLTPAKRTYLLAAIPVKKPGQRTRRKQNKAGIDYFKPAPNPEEKVLRQIKGNYRREVVSAAIKQKGLDSVPAGWKAHELSPVLKDIICGQDPRSRAGENLPNLEKGEVEIARRTLLDSARSEVTSLRARRAGKTGRISLRMVDEHGSEIALADKTIDAPLTAQQVVRLFAEAKPISEDAPCEVQFQSFFYKELGERSRRGQRSEVRGQRSEVRSQRSLKADKLL
jgi:hypothetical protein